MEGQRKTCDSYNSVVTLVSREFVEKVMALIPRSAPSFTQKQAEV